LAFSFLFGFMLSFFWAISEANAEKTTSSFTKKHSGLIFTPFLRFWGRL